MGIFGLTSFVMSNKLECAEFVDLIQVAKNKNGVELLVDTWAFLYFIHDSFWKSLYSITQNPWLRIIGAEYLHFAEYTSKFVADLRSLSIHLVFVVDGDVGSSKIGAIQKMETWKNRYFQDLDQMKLYVEVCAGRRNAEDIPGECRVRPVLHEIQLLETLNDQGCEVIQVVSGEADMVLVRELHSRPKAFAILANDSDFCVFEKSRFLPYQLFDLNREIHLEAEQRLPSKPTQLIVGIVTANLVQRCLQLPDHESVIEMSIYCGNDYTRPLLHSTRNHQNCGNRKPLAVGIPNRGDIRLAAKWTRKHKCTENDEAFAQEMRNNPELKEAVIQSRKFYKLQMASEEDLFIKPLSKFVKKATEAGQLSKVVGIHMGVYWRRLIMEDTSQSLLCAEEALTPLRLFVYEMLLDKSDDTVLEYGRTHDNDWKPLEVRVPKERRVVSVDQVHTEDEQQNLLTFHTIMTHQEPDLKLKFYQRYGNRNGFTCYVLRYFLKLNANANLFVTLDEFLALVATVFTRHQPEDYQYMCIAPNARCITIANWFQDIYRHAFVFLGKLLCLAGSFPQPCELFSGSTFIAYYVASVIRVGLPSDLALQLQHQVKDVIRERRHIVQDLTQGIFSAK